MSYKMDLILDKKMFHTRIVPCINYYELLEMSKDKNYLNELEKLEDFKEIESLEENKKKIDDINDGINLVINFLDNNDLYNLSKVNKYHYNKIMNNKDYKKRIFLNQLNKIPVYRSHIHKMGDMRTNAVRYLWLKKDFTIEEKALINLELILKCNTDDYPKYGEIRKIFSLYENGLMCQLQSYSGVIKTHSHDPYHKEYTFIVCFVLHSNFGYMNDIDNNNENHDVQKYKIIYFLDEQYDINNKNNEENQPIYKLVIYKMLEELNKMNELNSYKLNNIY